MQSAMESVSRAPRRIFRGWWIVAVAIVGQSFGIATPLVYTFGVFAKPLAAEFKSSCGSMAELFGCAFGSYTLGNATARYLIAAGFDATASYRAPLAVASFAVLLATLATFALGRYRQVSSTPGSR
jgi:hypothetical protein